MSVLESVLVAMFCLALVFTVLIIIYTLVMALSKVINVVLKRKTAAEGNEAVISMPGEDWDIEAVHASSGEMSLLNVDEKTAAMIMAIVSDESHIPLAELRFKSIRAIE